MSARNIYQKYCDGDPLSDDDLRQGIEHFKALARLAFEAGPVFALAAKEATRVFIELESFQAARKR